jgi:lysozyme
MKASEALKAHIKEREGLSLKAYPDDGGVWTIGYGHTGGVKKGDLITLQTAEDLFGRDLAEFEGYVNGLGLELTQGQFDALTDFCYNPGIGNLRSSTLLKKIRAGRPSSEIQNEFRKWKYCKGKVLAGLVKRREWEAQMWVS